MAEPTDATRAAGSLRRHVRLLLVIASVVAVVASAFSVYSVRRVLDARHDLVQEISPAQLDAAQLLAALVDQETGVRGYVLTGDIRFLDPYTDGQVVQADNLALLHDLARDRPAVESRIVALEEAEHRWRTEFAEPTLEAIASQDNTPSGEDQLERGRLLFDRVRAAVEDLEAQLRVERDRSRNALDDATVLLGLAVALLSALLLAMASAGWRLYRRSVERPLQALAADVERVREGDLRQPIQATGPAEIAALTSALELMRARLVAEIETVSDARAATEEQAEALERTNRDLEQFAYVASHDLQEPLRKVASFCQLLQSRYQGQLDERADEYIEFAVDGAKRMQVLINDLLAFSRVGRTNGPIVPVDCTEALDHALANLAMAIEEAGATVHAGPLPTVQAEPTLLVALFQNLIGNAVKFRHPHRPPTIEVSAQRVAAGWELAVRDDGIGIAPEYAERVFEVFKRLHTRTDYEGTGIGLALCRKIVDSLGGQIWVDTPVEGGTRICFTLPLSEEPAP